MSVSPGPNDALQRDCAAAAPLHSQSVAWEPTLFVGYSEAQLLLIKVGFFAALDAVYQHECGRTKGLGIIPIPVGHEFRVWDVIAKCWADDGYYATWTDAQHACSAPADL
jgi:hypothetical protein